MADRNLRVILKDRPVGVPQAHHFALDEMDVPVLADGQFLIKALYWSVDPAMRGWANDTPNYLPPVALGDPMRAFAVGEIVESRHPGFAAGQIVSGLFGWQRFAVSDGREVDQVFDAPDLSPSLALGVLGLNGVTAYFGLLDICNPQPGETVVVSTAVGAVGSTVGQIAKIKGARTVGITSSAAKVALGRDRFGYDAMISYRDNDLSGAILRACPDGVNCYFDNTSGPISDAVMEHLATGARITVCGTASITDWSPLPVGPRVHRQLLVARARMQGFLVLDYKDRFAEAVAVLAGWVREGRLVYDEHVLDGPADAPGAIEMLYSGQNLGKLIILVN